jgi:CO/xanthine dehydrogenase FAD-binding subunit
VAVKDFMVGPKRNSLAKGEIITAVELPAITGHQGYSKVGVRNAMVISIASACLVHDPLERSVRVAMGTVGPTIIRASETEQWLAAECDLSSASNITQAICTEFGRRCGEESRPITDHRSTAEYRRHAVSVITSRLLERCAAS